jgi:diketogulonate reductase-like aldo/keto reductase
MGNSSAKGYTDGMLIYGTAWKEDETKRLVLEALRAGFRAVDTANQRKHYFEAAVGAAIAESGCPRAELWLQTKFTHRGGQDDRLPYDPKAPIAKQVAQSFASSQEHLGTRVIDSYVLHGPSLRRGLAVEDWEAWRAMEALHAEKKTKQLGVSNVTAEQLRLLLAEAVVAPSAVQNRCYANTGWDAEVRAICKDRGIAYQGFSLLTANRRELAMPPVVALARKRNLTVPQLVFRFALDIGMTPLTGTTSPVHMAEDLAAQNAEPLGATELSILENV